MRSPALAVNNRMTRGLTGNSLLDFNLGVTGSHCADFMHSPRPLRTLTNRCSSDIRGLVGVTVVDKIRISFRGPLGLDINGQIRAFSTRTSLSLSHNTLSCLLGLFPRLRNGLTR